MQQLGAPISILASFPLRGLALEGMIHNEGRSSPSRGHTATAVLINAVSQESKESITYVNRVLAFMFATDESFVKLMALPKLPFKMCCGNQLCINLSHISSSAD